MSIFLTNKSKDYIKKINITNLLLDVNFIKEKCVQVYEPIIRIIQEPYSHKIETYQKISTNHLNLYLSKEFVEKFGGYTEFHIDYAGLIKKRLIAENVDPIIENICRINK